MKRFSLLYVLLAASLACSLTGAPLPGGEGTPLATATQPEVPTEAAAPALTDSDSPIPLDSGAAVTYKGLPLGLQDNGAPTITAVEGVIGVVCIGMSNANQECEDFMQKMEAGAFAGQINPQVRFVNCAVPGNAIERWNDPAHEKLWRQCERKILQAGLRPEQMRVVWHKAADMFTTDASGAAYPPYPDPNADYFHFYANLTTFASLLREKLPSVQAVYVSSRSYGGFADKASRSEPHSYEEGLALNQWLKDHLMVNGVWYGWGPYLWAPDCASGLTNGSGVCYERSDYQGDGIHPAQGARDKISQLLHERLSQFEWYKP